MGRATKRVRRGLLMILPDYRGADRQRTGPCGNRFGQGRLYRVLDERKKYH